MLGSIKNIFLVLLVIALLTLEYQKETLKSTLEVTKGELKEYEAKYKKLLEVCTVKDYQIKLDKFKKDINKTDFIPTDLSKQKEFNCTEADAILDVLWF